MPRTFVMTVDRELTDKVTPGNRVKIVGILAIVDRNAGNADASGQRRIGTTVKASYIRVLGIQSELNRDGVNTTGFAMPNISQDDEARILAMSKDQDIQKKISNSIASAIFGHADIKRAIACLLFGGSMKRLPDGMKLRGDINVLLLGDPSVAKS